MKIFNKFIIFVFVLVLNLFVFKTNIIAEEGANKDGVNIGTFRGIGGYKTDNASKLIENYTNPLEKILSNVVGFLTILGGIWFFVQFMIGGLGWAGAGGDTKKVEDARSKMTNAAIGLIAMVAAYSIIYIVGQILGLDILNVGKEIAKLGPQV